MCLAKELFIKLSDEFAVIKRMKEPFACYTEMGVVLESEGELVGGVSVIGGVHMNLASTRL